MSGVNLMDLIRKRHDGPAWVVVEEVGNGTGYNVSRHADAVAVGIWPSRGYEIHGYELKASRGDVQKELNDPKKADAVGRYCDFWWLAVTDESIIDGLMIPETWGILVPKNRVLRTVRKAPKRADVTPIGRPFIAALARRVTAAWVPKHVVDELKKTALEEARGEVAREKDNRKADAEYKLRELEARVSTFEADSGVKIGERWEGRNIARAVDAVMKARKLRESIRYVTNDNPAQLVRSELASIERAVTQHERSVLGLREAAAAIDKLLATIEAEPEPEPALESAPCLTSSLSLSCP